MAFESEALSPAQTRAAELNARLLHAHPREILRAAVEEYGAAGKLALVSSFGAESAVLLSLAAEVDPSIRCCSWIPACISARPWTTARA